MLQKQGEKMRVYMLERLGVSPAVVREIDRLFPRTGSGIVRLLQDDCLRLVRLVRVKRLLQSQKDLSAHVNRTVLRMVRQRTSLMRSLHCAD